MQKFIIIHVSTIIRNNSVKYIYPLLIALLFISCDESDIQNKIDENVTDTIQIVQNTEDLESTEEKVEDTTKNDINTTSDITPITTVQEDDGVREKTLSFFAWNGISNYDKVLELQQGYQEPTIYLNPIDNGSRDNFTQNVEYLQKFDSKVWFLLSSSGDENNPPMDYIQSQVDIITEYNSNHTKKIVGMMFDVESWIGITEQNSSENIEIWSRYLTFLQESKDILKSSNLQTGAVIPFWLDTITEAFVNGRAINYDVIDIVDETVIMDYTTDIQRFYNYAKSSLEYANNLKNKSIKIALETTDVGDDKVSFYNHISDITPFLKTDITDNSFKGFSIHTLDSFANHNLKITP